jgi:anti-anti-sigma regulatory factor
VYGAGQPFAEAARQYFAAGLARGDRLLWIGDDFPTDVGLPGAESLLARGALQLLPRSSSYEASAERFVPADQLAFYDAATRQARADGYHGLCVVAEVTEMAADPHRRADLVEWEHMADRFIADGSGMSAMCLYEGDRLPEETVTELATVHPWNHTSEEPPFVVWFDGERLRLAGCVDTFHADRLGAVLQTTPVEGAEVVLDLADLEFVDAAGTRVIARWAQGMRARGVAVRLARAPRFFVRVWRLLGFDQAPLATFAETAG